MGQQADPATDPAAVVAQVVAEHPRLALDDGHQTGAAAQEGGLARSVGALQQDDLAPVDGEVGAGEGREPTDQRDGPTEVDGRLHGRAEVSGATPGTTLSDVLTSEPAVGAEPPGEPPATDTGSAAPPPPAIGSPAWSGPWAG